MTSIIPQPEAPRLATHVFPEADAGFYYLRVPHTSEPDYDEAYWGTVVDPDGRVRHRLDPAEREAHLQKVGQELQFLRTLPAGRILDVGCGPGFLLSAVPNNWEKYGVEVSRYAAQVASSVARVFHGTVQEAGYLADYFDAIVMHHVIEHIPEPEETIAEVFRILKPNGALLIATPDFDSGCARRFGANYRLLCDTTHISLFSNESMHRFLRDFGFIIDRVEYPFFDTPYFTEAHLKALLDTSRVSPPFYGNFMTFYCRKPRYPLFHLAAMESRRVTALVAQRCDAEIELACRMISEAIRSGNRILVWGDGSSVALVERLATNLRGRLSSVDATLGAGTAGQPGDILLAIFATTPPPDLLEAIAGARHRGWKTVVCTGEVDPAGLRALPDVWIRIPAVSAARVQEAHLLVLHSILQFIELQIHHPSSAF